jgi:phosphonopyruvate decarboxylase
MSLGTLSLIASYRPPNLVHVVLDNEAYESTGGQPSISATTDLAALARAAGYPSVKRVTDLVSLGAALEGTQGTKALTFILAKVTGRAPEGLGRVSLTPEELKSRVTQVLSQAATTTRNTATTPPGPR